jgi:molybdopterin synthase sulfur carrier subunit|tara:strand:- start:231 stop:473 length:243 start_codon:yes stop_codon:yes gene_type:complete
MEIELLFFGSIQDVIGKRTEKVTLSSSLSIKEFRVFLEEKYPKLKTQTQFSMAINMEYATDEQLIENGDMVALIPPVSGG